MGRTRSDVMLRVEEHGNNFESENRRECSPWTDLGGWKVSVCNVTLNC